jgi:hypothetical protein
MNPRTRTLLYLLLPPIVAGTLAALLAAAVTLTVQQNDSDMPPAWSIFIFTYKYAFLPNVLSTAVMEYLYRRRNLPPKSAKALIASTLCWTVTGFVVFSFMTGVTGLLAIFRANNLFALTLFVGLGAVTGLITGLIARWAALRVTRHQKAPA